MEHFIFLHEAPNCGTLENRKQEKTDKKKGVSDDSLAFTTGMQRPTARIALEYGETGTQETGHGGRCYDVRRVKRSSKWMGRRVNEAGPCTSVHVKINQNKAAYC